MAGWVATRITHVQKGSGIAGLGAKALDGLGITGRVGMGWPGGNAETTGERYPPVTPGTTPLSLIGHTAAMTKRLCGRSSAELMSAVRTLSRLNMG